MRNALLVCLALEIFAGCQSTITQADKINSGIHANVTGIVAASAKTQASISAADAKICTASTQPGVPTESVQLITGAHSDLAAATAANASIAPMATNVGTQADQAQVLTDKTAAALAAEKNHWLGYKTRVLLWWLLGIVPVVAIVIFFVRTAGAGPIFTILGDAFHVVYQFLKRVFTQIGAWLGHILTLFSVKISSAVKTVEAVKVAIPGTTTAVAAQAVVAPAPVTQAAVTAQAVVAAAALTPTPPPK